MLAQEHLDLEVFASGWFAGQKCFALGQSEEGSEYLVYVSSGPVEGEILWIRKEEFKMWMRFFCSATLGQLIADSRYPTIRD
jgi:hypothetical protein